MRSSSSASSQSWFWLSQGSSWSQVLLQGSTSQLHWSPPRDGINQPPLHFWCNFFPPSSQRLVPHVFQVVFQPLFYLVRICCRCLTNSWEAPESNTGRDQSAVEWHKCMWVLMLLMGDSDLAVTWQVTDKACLMHCIQTNFLVHFFSGCLILPQWHSEHSSCSEIPKQLHRLGAKAPGRILTTWGLRWGYYAMQHLCAESVGRLISAIFVCSGFFRFWVLFVCLFVYLFFIRYYVSYPSLPAWMRNSKWNTAEHTTWPQMSNHTWQTIIPIPSVTKHTVENVCLVIHPSFCKGEGEVKEKAGHSPLIHTHICQLPPKLIDASWLTSVKKRQQKSQAPLEMMTLYLITSFMGIEK